MPYTKEQMKELAAAAMQANIVSVACNFGYELKEQPDGSFKVPNCGGMFLFPNGNRYFIHATDERGNVIDFVRREKGLNFIKACQLLTGENITSTAPKAAKTEYTPPAEKNLQLPEKSSTSRRVFAYLAGTRGLDPAIISRQMHDRKIAEQSERHNVMFIAYDSFGTAKYCGLRGSNNQSHFRQEASGSDKSFPWTITGGSDRVFVFESPIDAMSHATLAKIAGGDWQKDWRISIGGLSGQKALDRFLEDHPQIKRIVFGFVNDMNATYENGQPAPNWGQEKANKLIHEYTERGYTCTKHTPLCKDFNEQLMAGSRHGDAAGERSGTALRRGRM